MDNQTLPQNQTLSNDALTPTQQLPTYPSEKPKNNLLILLGSIVIFSIIFGAGGYYFGMQSKDTGSVNSDSNTKIKDVEGSPSVSSLPVVVSPSPKIQETKVVLPQGWKYALSQAQPNANDCVKIALPPMQPPYSYPLDVNRAPSVTEDKGSGRFWYLGGGSYPNLLSKVANPDTIKQNMTIFATEQEASGYISQAVSVACIPNTKAINNSQMILDLDSAVEKYNNSTGEKGMEAQKYILKKTTPTTRWGKNVVDYTVDEDGNETKYTMFATPGYIYEVKILGASTDSSVKQTAQKIFDYLSFD